MGAKISDLMPILPILFFTAATVLHQLWKKYTWGLALLLLLSCAVSLPPTLVNWDLVSQKCPEATSASVNTPQQIIGTWQGLALGVQGKLLSASPELLKDPIRRGAAKFPDIWWVRLTEQSRVGLIAGVVIAIGLMITMIFCFLKITGTSAIA